MNAFTRAAGWGQEETLPIYNFGQGQPFELTILGDPYQFQVAVNRQHLGEFSHRLNPGTLTHLNVVSGSNDVTVHCLWVEDPSMGKVPAPFPNQSPYPSTGGYTPYTSSVGGEQQYSQNPGMAPNAHHNGKGGKGLLGMVGSAGAAVAGALGASHLLGKSKGYPSSGGGYPGSQPQYGGYPASQPQYGGYSGGPPQYGGYHS
ncbi:Galectin-3 [Armadillidium vulgare]|nr:Galectin-3 [Armadillidium vulgare]